MNYQSGQTQMAPPSYDQAQNHQQSSDYASYPTPNTDNGNFGAPVFGEPANPSSHTANQEAARQTYKGPSGGQAGPSSGGLRSQPSGGFDANGAKTNPGFSESGANYAKQSPGQPTTSYQQPENPYMQTSDVGETGKSPMDYIVNNLNKLGKQAEGIAGNVWSHLKVGSSVTDSAWGRMSHGSRLLTGGGFEGVYKQTFGFAPNEQLRKTYACYLSTSTGPVGGTLYITNQKFAFCSDRPLSYAPTPGQQAWSYYKVIVPLDKVQEVLPSMNQKKPTEKYIQVVTKDGHEFWFMGFVNYDKGVKNMQEAVQTQGQVTTGPQGTPYSPTGQQQSGFAGTSSQPSYSPTQGSSGQSAAAASAQQGSSGNQYRWL